MTTKPGDTVRICRGRDGDDAPEISPPIWSVVRVYHSSIRVRCMYSYATTRSWVRVRTADGGEPAVNVHSLAAKSAAFREALGILTT